MLSIFESEYNASKNQSTGLAPFEVDMGPIPEGPSARKFSIAEIPFQGALYYGEMLSVFQKLAKDNLADARTSQDFSANRTRDFSLSFLEGDLVVFRAKRIF